MIVRVADYIMKRIYEEGVNHLFYVPGGQCVYLTDAVRRNEDIEGISVHHEQSAAMAALSYSLYNEKLGACLVTTGCAGTNTMTGVLHAWQDSIPMIVVSGQQTLSQTIVAQDLPLRQVGIQEADISRIMAPITKYAVTITDARDIGWQMDKALCLAQTGRPGPVWIDVPLDIQNAMVDETKLSHWEEEQHIPCVKNEDILYIKEQLSKAKRPVILIGEGVRRADAGSLVKQFVEQLQIPVTFTRFACDLLPYAHEQNFGILGSGGANRYANFTVQNSDFLLCIGTRLSIEATGPERQQFAREASIVVVDIDEVEHKKAGVSIDRFIHSDAKIFMEELLKVPCKPADEWWMEKCKHWKTCFRGFEEEDRIKNPINAKFFIEVMSQKMPENATVLSDAGFAGVITAGACQLKEGQRSIVSYAQGEMGYVLPGAIGVAPLCRSSVVAVSGDGSFMMNLQELQTVVRNQYNIKIVIMNNNGYSGVRHGQKAHFRGKSIGTDPSNGIDFPDYLKVADAFGMANDRIEKVEQIEEKLNRMFADDKPFLLEVMCDPEQFDLHNALVMYGKRKFGFRPIEDQSPFLDRETFFEEMIVEPMETSYGKPV